MERRGSTSLSEKKLPVASHAAMAPDAMDEVSARESCEKGANIVCSRDAPVFKLHSIVPNPLESLHRRGKVHPLAAPPEHAPATPQRCEPLPELRECRLPIRTRSPRPFGTHRFFHICT
jgi:hypothetical protein